MKSRQILKCFLASFMLVVLTGCYADLQKADNEMQRGVAIIDIGGGTSDIALFHRGKPIHTTILPVGGHQITNDIALMLGTPYVSANDLKINYGGASPNNQEEPIRVPSVGAQNSRTVSPIELENREGVIYKKHSKIPFTGSVRGKSSEGYIFKKTYQNGKVSGPYESYHKNGQLWFKGSFRNGKYEGPWVSYYSDGRLNLKYSGNYRDGVKILE